LCVAALEQLAMPRTPRPPREGSEYFVVISAIVVWHDRRPGYRGIACVTSAFVRFLSTGHEGALANDISRLLAQ
jgi:hypothetical protein